jgi:transposase
LIEPVLSGWRAEQTARGLGINEAKHDLREIVNAILYVNRTGIGWPYLPHDFPPHQSVYVYFCAWARDGTAEKIHEMLRRRVRQAAGRQAEPTAALIDAQSIRTSSNVPESSQGADNAKKIVGRKRHIATDTLGLLLVILITAASVQDTTGGRDVIDALANGHPSVVKTWVDAGYKSSVIARGAAHGIDVEVVTKIPGQGGFVPQPKRWAVERTLCAARRSAVFPENREGLEGRFLGRAADLDPKGEGDKSMLVCPVAGSRCQGRCTGRTRAIWRKLDCLNPNLQSMQVLIHRKDICNRCHALRRSRAWPTHPSERGATPSEGVEGDEWGAYVALLRTAETNAGSPVGREPYGDGGLTVVAGVTTGQGGRESRPQGEGGQVIGHPRLGRYA